VVCFIGSSLVCFIRSSFLPDTRATLVARTCGVGGGAGNPGTPPTLGITRSARHRPSGHKLSRPPMPQGLSAHPNGLQARPGRRPARRRPAACLSTHKRAPKKTPGPARPFQPARYGAARTPAAPRTGGGSRTRAAAQPAPPRTRRPPPAGSSRLPKTGYSARAEFPQTCPLRHAVFGRRRGATILPVTRRNLHCVALDVRYPPDWCGQLAHGGVSIAHPDLEVLRRAHRLPGAFLGL